MPVTFESVAVVALATSLPIAAAVTQVPQSVFEATGTGVASAIGFVLWRLANTAAAHLRGLEAHRGLEVLEWKQQQDHRESQREHWRSSR